MLHRICVLFIVVGLAVACDETAVEPPDERASDALQFDYANGPEQVAHLYRYQEHYVWVGFDFDRELSAVFATFPICNLPGEDLEPVSWQDNELPGGLNGAIQEIGKAYEAYVYVVDGVGFPGCASLPAYLLASGTGQFRVHDNDVYAWAEEHMRSNAWGVTGQGKLTLAGSGERARVNYVGNHVWDPNGEQNLHTDKINLTPDPR